ncbi:HlyC/CorC family transporter [bacterium]|nr:HlyC/CorC family transporter [bacterium]|tara:strand:+ start:6258 stop:7565 length:1308 start_codon:yes stop_codon:yes gene_type:complete
MSDQLLFFLVIFLLMLLSAFFSISESSIFSLQRYQVNLIKKKSSSGKLLETFINNPATIIGTILLLDEIINVGITSLISSKLHNSLSGELSHEIISLIAVLVTFILIIVFCEIIPKTIGVKFSRKLSINIAPIIYYVNKIMFPVTFIFNTLSRYLINITSPLVLDKATNQDIESKVTSLIDIGEDEGSVKKSESKIIDNLLSLQKINLIKILTPEPDLLILPHNITKTSALKEIQSRRLSRIPVYKGDTDNVIGILHSKDLLNHDSEDISFILHEPYFVPDKKNAFELLEEFQEKKIHIAVVLDEYGRLEGVVTLEDILEEIFGQIEYEKETDTNLINYVNNSLEVSGGLRISEFNGSCLYATLRIGGLRGIGEEIQDSYIPEDLDIETVGGFIFTNIGRLPLEGDNIVNGAIKLTVLKVEGNRITKILVERFKN